MKKIISIMFVMLFAVITAFAEVPDGIVPIEAKLNGTVSKTVSKSRDFYTSKDYANRDGVYYEKATELVFYISCAEAGVYTLKTTGYRDHSNYAVLSVNDTVVNSSADLGWKQNTGSSLNEVNQGQISLNEGINTISFKGNANVYIRSIALAGELVGLPQIKLSDDKLKVTYEAETSGEYIISDKTMSFMVNCQTEGEYYFTTYFERNYGTDKKLITVSVNGDNEQSFNCRCGGYAYTSNTPSRFRAVPLSVYLTKGKNIITVTPPEKLAFDKFELTNYERGSDGEYVMSDLSVEKVKETFNTSPSITVFSVYDKNFPNFKEANVKAWWSDNDNNKTRAVCLALYDENGSLVKTKIIQKRFMKQLATCIAFNNIDLSDIYKIKLFVMESMETLKPLAALAQMEGASYNYLTSTRITPWLANWHITSTKELENGEMGGEGGQMTFALAVSPFDNDIVITGTDTVGIWRSTDGGNNWENTSNGLVYPFVNDLLYDTENEGVVYMINAGSSQMVQSGELDMGVYKSVDNGENWALDLGAKYTLTNLGGRDQLSWQTYNQKRYLYAATMGSGIYRRASDETQWKQIYTGTDIFYDIHTGDDGLIIAVGSNGIIKSTDNGQSWTKTTVSVDGVSVLPKCIAVHPDDSKIWFTVDDKSLYRSDNSGESWIKVSQKLPDYQGSILVNVSFSNYRAEDNPRMFFSGSKLSAPLRYADDMGVWQFEKLKYVDEEGVEITSEAYWPQVFDFPDASNKMFMMHKGFCSSEDGGASWSVVKTHRLSGLPMTDIEFDFSGKPVWMSFIDSGLWICDEGNIDGELYPTFKKQSFVRFDGYGGYVSGSMSSSGVEIDPNNTNHILAITGDYGYSEKTAVVQSYDGGITWESIKDKDGNAIAENKSISFLEYHPTDKNIIYTGYLISEDNGKTWSELPTPVEDDNPDTQADESSRCHIVDISKNGRLLACDTGHWSQNMHISDDNGRTWTKINTSPYGITDVCFDLADDNYVWASKFKFLYKINLSTGAKEEKASYYSIRNIIQNPNDANHILINVKDVSSYRTSSSMIYETFDGGEEWHAVEGYPNIANTISIKFHPSKPIIYMGSYIGTLVYNYEEYQNR